MKFGYMSTIFSVPNIYFHTIRTYYYVFFITNHISNILNKDIFGPILDILSIFKNRITKNYFIIIGYAAIGVGRVQGWIELI